MLKKSPFLTRPTPARRDAPFPRRRSRFAQKLNVPKRTPSLLRSLRPCWTAFLSILRNIQVLFYACEPLDFHSTISSFSTTR